MSSGVSRLVLGLVCCAQTWAIRSGAPVRVRCSAAPSAVAFSSPAWERLQKHLDTLPVFTCVNERGEPLGYERDGQQLAIYFADVERAQQELATKSEQFPALRLRLLGAGLGAVFREHTAGSALLVPSQAALAGAGDEWDSETLPLYTCLSLSSQAPEGTGLDLEPGTPTTPLFMSPEDAQASLEAALGAARQNGLPDAQLAQMQLACTSLPLAVELVLSGREVETCGNAFQFVAPRSSLVYLREQQQQRRRRTATLANDEAESLIFPS